MPQTRKDVIDALDSYTYDLERELRDTKDRLERVLADRLSMQNRITRLVEENRMTMELAETRISTLTEENRTLRRALRPVEAGPVPTPDRPAVVTLEEYRLGARPSEK